MRQSWRYPGGQGNRQFVSPVQCESGIQLFNQRSVDYGIGAAGKWCLKPEKSFSCASVSFAEKTQTPPTAGRAEVEFTHWGACAPESIKCPVIVARSVVLLTPPDHLQPALPMRQGGCAHKSRCPPLQASLPSSFSSFESGRSKNYPFLDRD